MDLDVTLKELYAEKKRIERIIARLEQRQRVMAPTHNTASTPRTRKMSASNTDDPNQMLRSLMDADETLRDCLNKIDPSDPLGVLRDTPEHAAERNACLQRAGH